MSTNSESENLRKRIQVAMNSLEKRHLHYGEPRNWQAYWDDRDSTVEALVTQLLDEARIKAKREVLDDLLEWEKLWFDTHLSTDRFNWHGAVKAMLVMKEPRKPFVELQAKLNKKGE